MKKFLFLTVFLSLFIFSCTKKKCEFGFKSRTPSASSLNVDMGTKIEFSAEPELCGEETTVLYSWRLNGSEVSKLNSYTLFACGSVLGDNKVELTISDTRGNTADAVWSIRVNQTDPPARPQCVVDSINRIQQGGRFGDYAQYFDLKETEKNLQEFTSARDCIDLYLNDYVCDLEANYADAIARTTLELHSIDSFVNNRSQRFTREEILSLLERLNSIEGALLLIRQEGNFADFASTGFIVSGILEIGVWEGEPSTLEDDIWINLSGRHDMGEAAFLLTGLRMIKGMLEVLLSYTNMIEFGASVPDDPGLEVLVGLLIDRLEAEPEFLTLYGPGGREGRERLSSAQLLFADGLRSFWRTLNEITSERSDQSLGIVRYWDCGNDAVCPGDPEERSDTSKPCGSGNAYQDKNLNGECNRAHCSTTGANPSDCEPPDEGEGNSQFDSGEPIGTQMIAYYDNGSFTYRRVTFPLSSWMKNAIELIAKNIEGPDALDFNALLGLPSGTVEAFLNGFGIPVPEVRLSEFFVTPSNLRDLVPLYSKSDRFFIYQTEVENFYDVGYDGCDDSMEDGTGGCTGNPGVLPDPNHDNFNINTNCEDGFDNDADGNFDEYNSSGICADLGPEGDLQFSFVDANGNGKYDPGEIHEPIDDTGIYNGKDTVGANNGNRDEIDVEHFWPQGEDVGGAHPGLLSDPRNTTSQDQTDADGKDFCIDPYYFFLPDPTFSGVLTFPQQIINIDGIELNSNSKLHRFVSKSLETAEEMGVIE